MTSQGYRWTFRLFCDSQQLQQEKKKKKNLQIIRTDQLSSKEALKEGFFLLMGITKPTTKSRQLCDGQAYF